jgi:hypothetical protein
VKVAPTDSRHLEKELEVRLAKLQVLSRAMTPEAWECVHMEAFVYHVVVQMAAVHFVFVQLVVVLVID